MKKILILLTASILSLFGATFNVSTTPELRTALSTAATNGEDDTIIIADGTYKTTDDGQGTFIYLSNEANKLTLQGSSAENVILSGDKLHQILNHQSTENASMTLEKLSFVDGNNTATSYPNYYGGGVYTDYSIEVTDCNFTNNSAKLGGGIYIDSVSAFTTVINTEFLSNIATNGAGGGFSAYSNIIIRKSIFRNNKALGSSNGNGGGFNSSGAAIVNDTAFIDNTSERFGGGFAAGSSTNNTIVINSIFIGNIGTYGGGLFARNLKATNLLFASNNTGVYLYEDSIDKIYNSIFLDNNTSDISGKSGAIISNLENNYIDTSKLTISNFAKNNIYDEVTLGFVNEANEDYRLSASSGLIDEGTTTVASDVTLQTTDFDGNARIVGGGIDIGPYEFSTTKPTITAFTHSGTAKELSPLTFNVVYSLSSDRTLGNISYDYTNDGSWTSLNTHTFNTAGTYTVNVKVTDSAVEYSTQSVTITIAPLAFNDMTAEQKLVKAIDPIYYDEIMTIIANEKESSRQSAITVGEINVLLDPSAYNLVSKTKYDTDIADINTTALATGVNQGKQYVQDNLTEFNLVTKTALTTAISDTNTTAYNLGLSAKESQILATPSAYGLVPTSELNTSVSTALATGINQGKQYVQDNLTEFNLVTKTALTVSSNEITSLPSGFTLIGTKANITDLSIFNDASIIWTYIDGVWNAYSSNSATRQKIIDANIPLITNIPANSGIWVGK